MSKAWIAVSPLSGKVEAAARSTPGGAGAISATSSTICSA